MDMLRWILLILGAVVVAGIYLYTTQQRHHRGLRRNKEVEPEIEIEGIELKAEKHDVHVHEMQDELMNLDALLQDEREHKATEEPQVVAEKEAVKEKKKKTQTTRKVEAVKKAPDAEMFVILHVAAKMPELFQGQALLNVLNESGLEFGELGIFHRHRELGGRDRILFSVASMVKPGTLVPAELEAGLEIPGISLFMRLPSSIPGEELYRDLLDCTEQLARSLDGKILDEHRSVLTQQAMQKVLEDIRLFELKTGT
jgi:cell division protein ZipA